ncbi:hypothetical protein LIER_11251 [Lithospermum erythrorhizon]|uniref:Uncharacterized protein n=1 Tax=Lithospermum erythrorhizon TaxID=34254 RepID=A0AAV3PMF4_LITER
MGEVTDEEGETGTVGGGGGAGDDGVGQTKRVGKSGESLYQSEEEGGQSQEVTGEKDQGAWGEDGQRQEVNMP